jgi:hypothetical protein
MKNFFLVLIFSFSLIVFFYSCDDTTKSTDQVVVIPDKNVSYSQHIQPLFNNHCNFDGCHDDGDRAGGLSLTSYGNTTSSINIVFKGRPENSELYQVVVPGAANFMPPLSSAYAPLNKNQITGIYTWIKEGANPN